MAYYGGGYGGYGYGASGIINQEFEQDRIGYGQYGYGLYDTERDYERNPYTGQMSIENDFSFTPFGGGYGGYGGRYY